MAQDSRSSLFMGALIGSAVSALLLIATDFGGWYNNYYYAGYQEWYYIGVSSPISLLGVILLCLPFIYCAYISLKGVQNPDSVTSKQVSQAFMLSLVAIILIIILAVVFVALVSGSDDWWFGASFYGSLIGGSLTVIFLSSIRKQYAALPRTAGQYYQSGASGIPLGYPPSSAYDQIQASRMSDQPYTYPTYSHQTASIQQPSPGPAQIASTQVYQPAPPSGTSEFCPFCGNNIPKGSTFCPYCGKPTQ